jgi:hypothetical protein
MAILAIALPCFGQGATSWNIYSKPNGDWWTGNAKDIGWRWAKEIDALTAGGGATNIGTGNIYYVDSGLTIAGDGSSWSNALATLDEAFALCTSNNGDIVYVAQGHAETWSTAALGATIDKIGVTVEGVGEGSNMPTFTYTHAGATIDISVANVMLKNLRFVCGATDVVSSVTLTAGADYLTISGCEWVTPTTGTWEFLDMITLATGSDFVTIAGNKFMSLVATTGCNQAINGDAGIVNRLLIVGNEFQGTFTVAAVHSDKVNTNMLVAGNVVHQATAGQFGLEFTEAATGILAENLVYTNAVATAIDPGSLACFENYIINTIDLSAELFPPESAIATVTAGSADDILKKLYYTADGTDAFPATVANDSTLAKIMGIGAAATVATYDNTTMSLQALNVDLDAILSDTALWDTTAKLQTILFGSAAAGATAAQVAALTTQRMRNSCEVNAGGATNFTSVGLAGFGTNYFETGWSAICVYDAGAAAGAPEGEIRDITAYVTATGVFTVAPAFSQAVTTGDLVMLVRTTETNPDVVTMLGGSGSVWYVDSGKTGTSATAAELGKTWTNAYTTVALAIAAATASNGDVIYVAPGHAETLAAAVAINVAGVTIKGFGEATLMPTITLDTAADQWDVSVANVHIENIRFLAGATDILKGIDLAATADGCHIKNCIFEDATTSEILNAIDVAAGCDDVTIEGCQILTPGNAATEGIKLTGAVDNIKIINNWIFGTFTVAGIWSDQICTNVLIKDNVVTQLTSGQLAVEFTAATTGNLTNNTLSSPLFATMLDPGSMICSGNMGSSVLDEAGIEIPISALTTDITETGDGSNLERLEYLQNKSDDILAGLRMAGGTIGDVYYVDSVTGNTANSGISWALAEALISQGYGDVTANKGDIVFVAPGHTETHSADAQVALATAGVTIIGLGDGTDMPFVDMQHANSSFDVTGASNTIKGINFHSSTAATAIGVHVAAADFTMEDCLFTDAGNFEFAITVSLDASAELSTIRNCRLLSVAGTTGATSGIAAATGVIDRLIIENCRIWGDFTNAGIYSDQINTNALIKNNSVTNNNSGQCAIEFTGATTGDLIDNMLSGSTYGSILDPGSLRCFGNKQCVGVDTGAEDIPLIAGKSYTRCMKLGDLNALDDLFLVTGAPIVVTSFVGKATVACGGATTLEIQVDADDTWDYDLSTGVDVDTIDAGGILAFTAAIGESVLTVQAVGSSGSMGPGINWWVEEGMLESNVSGGGSTGEIEWYMIFTPVENGCEVIPQ